MKYPREELNRWIAQATHDLVVAKKHATDEFFADACYYAEQAAQKALKGYLYFKGQRAVFLHSVKELVDACASYDSNFRSLVDIGKTLDQYYIPTRYPDALAPPAVPFESYTSSQALDAIASAERILTTVEKAVQN